MTSMTLTTKRSRGRLWPRVFAVAGSLIAISIPAHLLGSYLPEAGRALGHPHLDWLAVTVGAELVSIGAFSELQRTALRASGTRIGIRRMLGLTFEANAVSESLLAGSAFAAGYSFRRFRTWGTSAPAAGYALLAAGLLSTVAFGGLTVVAVSVAGGASASPVPALLAAALLTSVLLGARRLRRDPGGVNRLLQRGSTVLNRIRRRPPTTGPTPFLTLIAATSKIRPTARMWSGALLFAAINWAADFACLLAASRAVAMSGTTFELAVSAYIAGMSVSSISVAPGGLGIVEGAMILVFSHGGIPRPAAIASVLLYRLISYGLMVVIGWSLWLISRRRAA